MNHILNKRLLLCAVVVAFLSAPSAALSQTTQPDRFSLEVSPPVKYIQIKPGSKLSHTITLKNIGAYALEVSPLVVDFTSDGETNIPILQDSTSFQYIEIPKGGWPTLPLKPNQTAQLTLNFVVPADAVEREYPLTVLFNQRSLDQIGNGSRVSGAVGSNLIVLISNKNKPAADLSITSTGIFPLLDTFSTLTIDPLITNNGFSAQPIHGTVTIRNWRGSELTKFTLFPDVVLGGSSRRARGTAPATDSSSPPEPQEMSYKPGWLLGLYQVDIQIMTIEPGTEDAPVYVPLASQRQSVVALPYVVVIVLLVSIMLALTYAALSRKQVTI